jgi:hypothetical protein
MVKSGRMQNPLPHLRRTSFRACARKWVLVIIILFAVPHSHIKAQQPTMDYAVHANIIYHFTKYIDWPPAQKSGDFVIGVVGDSPLYDALKKAVSLKTAGQQRIVVKRLSPSLASFDCQILFVTAGHSSSLKKIISRSAGVPMLIVSEEEGLASRGSCINFVIVADRLKLEINKTSIEERNMSIASELLKLGKIVK